MNATTRLIAVAGLVVALAIALFPAAATAHKKRFLREVTMDFQRNPAGVDSFFGVVTSPAQAAPEEDFEPSEEPFIARSAGASNPRCVRGALVELRYRPGFEGGGGSEFQPTVVARTRTDKQGNWQISHEVTGTMGPGEFSTYGVAVRKNRVKPKDKKHKHICKGAFSETKTILNPQYL